MQQDKDPSPDRDNSVHSVSIALGIVLQRQASNNRWVKWVWKAVAVIPGAPDATWKVPRKRDDKTEFHATTMALVLHRTDVEAYRVSLAMTPPSIFVILRESVEEDAPHDVAVHAVTASAYEAQDYTDSGEEIVEPVAIPDGLIAWIEDFVDANIDDTPFIKRKRDKQRVDLVEDGVGDERIRQETDVYRAPGAQKPPNRRLQ